MKKIIIAALAVGLILVAYLAQVFYMGALNQKIYDFMTVENKYYSIKNKTFEKGFFSSKANFEVVFNFEEFGYPLNSFVVLGQMLPPIKATVTLKNNIFASDNINIDIENPFHKIYSDLNIKDDNVIFDKVFLNIKANASLFNKINVKYKINDITLKPNLTLSGLNFQTELDKEGKIHSLNIDLGEFSFSEVSSLDLTEKISLKNLHYEETIDKGVNFSDFLEGYRSGKAKFNLENLEALNISFDDIKIDGRNDVNNDKMSGIINLNIKNINSPLSEVKLDDIKAQITSNLSVNFLKHLSEEGYYTPTSDEKIFFDFLATEPIIELTNLSFNSNGKKVVMKGTFKGFQEQSSTNLSIQSEALMGEIFPILNFFNIDEYFIEKDGGFALDLLLTTLGNDSKIILNGQELNLIQNGVQNFDAPSDENTTLVP